MLNFSGFKLNGPWEHVSHPQSNMSFSQRSLTGSVQDLRIINL